MISSILRLFPPFKGKQRLSRFLLQRNMRSVKDVVIKGRYGCMYKLPNIIENVGFDIYVDGVFENDSIRFILEKLPANATWVDMGANIGSICIPICKRRPDVKALCIEASPRVYSYLEHNVRINKLDNIMLVNKALADADHNTVHFFSPEEKFGKGSLSSVFTKNAEEVQTITLDTLLEQLKIKKVDFIKVDIEGYEYHAFKGASALLSDSDAPDILFEFIDWAENASHGAVAGDAQQMLISYGYSLYRFEHHGHISLMGAAMKEGNALIYASKKKNIL